MGKRRQAYGIIYILNFGKTIKQKPLWVAKSHNQKNTNNHANNKTAGTRYVGEKTINMRATPGLRGHAKEKIDYGQSVEYTGNNETLDGIKRAEVKQCFQKKQIDKRPIRS